MLWLKELLMFFSRKKNENSAVCNVQSCAEVPCLIGAAVSDVGCVRANNEDNFVLGRQMNPDCANHSTVTIKNVKDQWLFAGVFDGMGGGEIGEVAAQTTAQVFLDAISRVTEKSSDADIDSLLREAFLTANNKIVDMQQTYQVYGTTGTVLAINPKSYKIYHLGDSRAYLFRDNQLFQLTRDQTLAQMKIDVGLYKPDDPMAEAEKHKLTEFIGKDVTKEHICPVESEWITLVYHDALLLCSDGLYDMCSDSEISEILKLNADVLDKTKELVQTAVANGGADNVTCILLSFSDT